VKLLVVTNCTNRKRPAPTRDLMARSLAMGDAISVARAWWERVEATLDHARARDVYKGRAFAEAVRVAEVLDTQIWIVSAGLGLFNADDAIPSYSLTISPGFEDTVLYKANCTPQAWWRALSSIGRRSDWPDADLVLLALSGPYLAMVAPDLSNWPQDRRDRLRIFSGASPADIDSSLRSQVMPYDGRLDDRKGPIRGTQADFAQRAMRHFAETVLPASRGASTAEHLAAVETALSGLRKPERPDRTKLPDAEIIELIQEHWMAVGGRSGRMLRRLRDELGVACEQGRFKSLFKLVPPPGQSP
jgi:hypothetical protein